MKGPLISQHSGRLTPLKSGSAGPDGKAIEERVRVGSGGREGGDFLFFCTNG